MIERVKIHVRGKENLTWKTSDYLAMLEEAAKRMWRAVLETPARKFLRETATSTLAANGVVECPSDCIRIETVEALFRDEYVPLAYRPDDDVRPFPPHLDPPGWTDDQPEGGFRVLGVRPGATIRLRYFAEPVFPFEDDGTFEAPDGETATYNLPKLADSACEHLAAALLLGEETSDSVPIGYHGNQYASLVQSMAREVVAKPSRTYVRRVSGRRFW